jgi:hypothetical protein
MVISGNNLVINGTTVEAADLTNVASITSDVQTQLNSKANTSTVNSQVWDYSQMPSGSVLQVRREVYKTNNVTSTTSTTFTSTGLMITITPKSTTSYIDVCFNGNQHTAGANQGVLYGIWRDGNNLHLGNSYDSGAFVYSNVGGDEYNTFKISTRSLAGTLSPITFILYFRSWAGGVVGLNWHASELVMTATEIKN